MAQVSILGLVAREMRIVQDNSQKVRANIGFKSRRGSQPSCLRIDADDGYPSRQRRLTLLPGLKDEPGARCQAGLAHSEGG